MVDTIAQLTNTLKNGNKAGKETVEISYSKMKEAILETLHKEGFVGSVSKKGKKVIKTLEVELLYVDGKPRIQDIKQISKNSRRMYTKASQANAVKNGYGAMILSTPAGILSDTSARKQNVGGEVLFKIW